MTIVSLCVSIVIVTLELTTQNILRVESIARQNLKNIEIDGIQRSRILMALKRLKI